jgi:aminoglycoside phosphotransferase (APT) family kinase protein
VLESSPNSQPSTALLPDLRHAGLIAPDESAECRPLRGGVSSDIVLVVAADGRKFVVKRALAQLRVKDPWFADPARNRSEQAWFDYVAPFAPEAVPRILHRGPDWFAMEFLGGDLKNWKEELLAGRVDVATARAAGHILGRVHAASWNEPRARAEFQTGRSFYDLRIEPYLVTTAQRQPAVRRWLEAEAARLAATEVALVHGDFSPKNLLVSPSRLVVLDAEVAWFGDPAFDLAFLLTHLHLKALVAGPNAPACLGLVPAFWSAYGAAMAAIDVADLEIRATRLLLMIMLARVHGKSPVEYLSAAQQAHVTHYVTSHLPRQPESLAAVTGAWEESLRS